MTPDERPLTDQLASALNAHLREHLWDGPSVALHGEGTDVDGTPFPALDEDDTVAAGGSEFDVILRAPAGTLYDVHTHVAVTVREPTAVVDRVPVGSVIVDRVLAAETRESIWAGRDRR